MSIRDMLYRFGGRNLKVKFDEKLAQDARVQREIMARISAVEVDIDIVARRKLKYR
jgi:hypothetical protein